MGMNVVFSPVQEESWCDITGFLRRFMVTLRLLTSQDNALCTSLWIL